jgi:replicative DNA helicase
MVAREGTAMPANSLAVRPPQQPRKPARSGDPFDVSGLVNESAERQYLAGLLDVLDERPGEARELASLVQPAMLAAVGTAEVHEAILAAFEAVGQPARADVLAALRGNAAAVGVDCQSDPARHLFIDLVADEFSTGPQAARLSRQAAAEVADLHRRRRGIMLAADYVLGLRYGESDGVSQLVEAMQTVRLEGPGRGVMSFTDAVAEWSRHERVPTVRTLLEPFDRATEGGLPIGGLTMFVAPPQAGKSAMAVQLVLGSLLADADLRVTYGLGEMDPQSLARRLACVGASLLGHEPVTMADAGARSRQARETLARLVEMFGDRLSVVQSPLTVERLDEQVQRTGAKLVVIDYLQLVAAEGESRVEQLDAIVGRLRDLAIRRQAAVIVISSMAKATGEGSRIGQFTRGTGEADYAAELLYLAAVDEHEDADGTRGVVWQCKKARNLRQVDVELRFDGSLQTFSGVVEPFVEFERFEPGRSA